MANYAFQHSCYPMIHRRTWFAATFSVLVITSTIGSAGGTFSGGAVANDKPCYAYGENIVISFQSDNPEEDDWVGIYPSNFTTGLEEPIMWVWTCGTQDCWGRINGGSLTFGEGGVTADYLDIWPLELGEYRAVLARDSETQQDTYEIYAISDYFTVVPTIDLCFDVDYDTTETSLPTSLLLLPTTLQPTGMPSSRPSLRASTTPPLIPSNTNMAAVIASAKRDIGLEILVKPALSATFLRMIFHDCVSGCDGCINMSNHDNAKLDDAMNVLALIVAKYEPKGLSRPDIWVLASATGVEMAMQDTEFLAIPFKAIGRQPCSVENVTQGPNPDVGSANFNTDDLVTFFNAHFGFTPQETAAILGGHTIGTMTRNVRGFDGENGWTVDNASFNNGYYAELVGPGTTLEDQVNLAPNWQQVFVDNSDLDSVPNVYQWEGWPTDRKIVMTNADIALVRQLHDGNKEASGNVACQFVPRGGEKPTCPMARSDVFSEMVRYRNDNQAFLEAFRDAFIKMTQNGYSVDTSSCDEDGICRLTKVL